MFQSNIRIKHLSIKHITRVEFHLLARKNLKLSSTYVVIFVTLEVKITNDQAIKHDSQTVGATNYTLKEQLTILL